MGTAENTAVVVAAYEAFGQGDIASLIAANSPDTVWEIHSASDSPMNGVFKGHDGLGEFFTMVGTLLDFSKFEMQPIASEANVVVARGENAYTVKATGKTVDGPLVHIFTFDGDGQVIHFEEFESNADGAYS